MPQIAPVPATVTVNHRLGSYSASRRALLRGVAGAGIAAAGWGRLPGGIAPGARAQGTGGNLIIGYTQEQPTLDAPVPNSDSQSRLLNSMLDPLVWQPESGVFEPGLATSWESSEDSTVFTFHLREDVIFHDGTPFDAEAVKVSFDRVADPELRALLVGLLGPYEGDGGRRRVHGTRDIQRALSSLPRQPEQDRHPSGLTDSGREVRSRFRAERRRHRAVQTPIVLRREHRPGALRRVQLGSGLPRARGPGLSRHHHLPHHPRRRHPHHGAGNGRGAVHRLHPPQEVDRSPPMAASRSISSTSPVCRRSCSSMSTSSRPRELPVRQAIQYAINHQAIVDVIWFGKAKPSYGVLSSCYPRLLGRRRGGLSLRSRTRSSDPGRGRLDGGRRWRAREGRPAARAPLRDQHLTGAHRRDYPGDARRRWHRHDHRGAVEPGIAHQVSGESSTTSAAWARSRMTRAPCASQFTQRTSPVARRATARATPIPRSISCATRRRGRPTGSRRVQLYEAAAEDRGGRRIHHWRLRASR